MKKQKRKKKREYEDTLTKIDTFGVIVALTHNMPVKLKPLHRYLYQIKKCRTGEKDRKGDTKTVRYFQNRTKFLSFLQRLSLC